LAVRIETFMKRHNTLSLAFLERQCEKVPLWNALYNQIREASEAEPFVVVKLKCRFMGFRELLIEFLCPSFAKWADFEIVDVTKR
jgi:hypothetical protein